MKQLIDKREVLNLMDLRYWGIEKNPLKVYEEVRDEINYMPSVEIDRPSGVWVGIDEEILHEQWKCSNCGNILDTYWQDELEEHKYCHKCGAKMSTP